MKMYLYQSISHLKFQFFPKNDDYFVLRSFLNIVESRLSSFPLYELYIIWIGTCSNQTFYHPNYSSKFRYKVANGLKCDQAFVAYHSANRLANRPHPVSGNPWRFFFFKLKWKNTVITYYIINTLNFFPICIMWNRWPRVWLFIIRNQLDYNL